MTTRSNASRYLAIADWAAKRYATAEGYIVMSHGLVPSIYSRIELAAFRRYVLER